MLTQTQQDILALLKKSNHILVLPSAPIDGDSLGSALSLYLTLRKLGKKVTVVAADQIPASYAFLPESGSISHELSAVRDFIVTIDCREAPPEHVRHEIQGNKINFIVTPHTHGISKESVTFSEGPLPYDCIVAVDAGDVSQFGKTYETFTELFHLAPVINIDHHASNSGFGKINMVDIMAPSTTTMILPLIEELGTQLIDADIATLLLAGLITDTGSFQNANTTPDAFALAAKLIGYGARQQEIIRNVYKTKKLSTLRLWGRTLTKIQYDEKHKLVWSVLTARDFAELGSSPDETEGVIDELMSNAPNAEIIFLLKEKSPTEASGSIRTVTPTVDSSKLAEMFGGGGHVQAAGFKMSGKSIVDVEKSVVEGMRAFQAKRLKIGEAVATAPATPTPSATPVTAAAIVSPVRAEPPLWTPVAPTATPTPVAAAPVPPSIPAAIPVTPVAGPVPVRPVSPARAEPPLVTLSQSAPSPLPAAPNPALKVVSPTAPIAPPMPMAPKPPVFTVPATNAQPVSAAAPVAAPMPAPQPTVAPAPMPAQRPAAPQPSVLPPPPPTAPAPTPGNFPTPLNIK